MVLHRLSSVTIGVPNVADTASYYSDFGLEECAGGWFATQDGGRQLCIQYAATRRLLELVVGVDDQDDLERASNDLARIGAVVRRGDSQLSALEPVTGIQATLRIQPRFVQPPEPAPVYNGPGRLDRKGQRAAGILRTSRVLPRKLGHVVTGTTDLATTVRFFTEGLGFKISDSVRDVGYFLRCSVDHHNLLVQHAPVSFLHHTSWQVPDVDDIGRAAQAMLEGYPERHVWGLGRHHAGSNFFWYLKDPAGNFSEYYSDMDCIIDDQLWTPETFEGAKGLYNWGPPPPPSFVNPEDLAELMAGSHSS